MKLKIIVPTDFSPAANNALQMATKFDTVSDIEIILLHVIEPPSASFSSMGESIEKELRDVFVVKLASKIDEEFQAIKDAHSHLDIRTIRKIGDPYTIINDMIQWEKVDLVIMGEKGVADIDNLFIGSLTDKIVRTSRYPVISVNQFDADQPIERILYATDLEEDHPRLVQLLKNLQYLFDAKLHIVKVNTRKKYMNDIETERRFQHLIDKYELQNLKTHTFNHEDEEDGIILFADKIQTDLIAIGVHKKSGFRRLISGGDLAQDVTDHSNRPVLTYHFDGKVN